ncbi:hydroxyatrazine ethylaminohydrolase protein [Salinisphaera shabanensis E1L3A]|uniref:Hydroxyatrazine ethylaminohydrolase protein n=1 Tax=Salinisphaera shabanensis E1L3A TaxID=1033802 RepID=U2FUK3_9GAMM|nr:amidohydrolase family protein [Salinisphaera shabanensis]ERJ19624.1 hydroxyatrazine ethylaminohydrolase protein [Salinisphaera shabanensis E1L3A]
MTNWLIKNPIDVLNGAPGRDARVGGVDIRVRDGVIAEMAPGLAAAADETTVDASRCVVYPGWVNTHHHLFQAVLKGVPEGIDKRLFDWLRLVPYPRLTRFTPELLRVAAKVGLAELALSGTTTCADHHYLYHRDGDPTMADVLFEVAEEMGLRFVLCRGGQTQPAAHPGYPKDLAPETLDQFLGDIQRLHGRFHDPAPNAKQRVIIAPATPTFSVSPQDLRVIAAEARRMGLRLHSHLSETEGYVDYCAEHYGMRPVEFVAEHDWVGEDVYYAHMVHVDESEFSILAQTKTGIAHCPQSNARLGSGIGPIPAMAERGIPISIGVDGAASNEAADMISETHEAWLVHRTRMDAAATHVEDVVHWGTRGGAEILGLDAIGTLAVGQDADLVLYDLDAPRYCGMHDPAIAPVTCAGTPHIKLSMMQGRTIVDDGVIPGLDMGELAREAAAAVRELV